MMPGNRRKSTARLSKKLQSFVLTGSLHADGTDGGANTEKMASPATL